MDWLNEIEADQESLKQYAPGAAQNIAKLIAAVRLAENGLLDMMEKGDSVTYYLADALLAHLKSGELKEAQFDVQAQMERQRRAYERRYGSNPDFDTWDEMSPEDRASVCERCGEILNPEIPIAYGEPVLCGWDICYEEDK